MTPRNEFDTEKGGPAHQEGDERRVPPPPERPGCRDQSGRLCRQHVRPVSDRRLESGPVDAGTARIYDKVAPEWQRSRGEAADGLGRRFRELAGEGLVADLGCGPGRYLSAARRGPA